MWTIIVCHLLALYNGSGGHQDHPVALEIFDRVRIAGMVEEGHVGVNSGPDSLHAELGVLHREHTLHYRVPVVLKYLMKTRKVRHFTYFC